MKASMCALTAAASSMLAASLATLTASNDGNSSYVAGMIFASSSSAKEKFTPRFDGLRFIETLVTAHR
ncbi:hypothetical protein MLD38_019142 [Melastoma candidum]|uniref:Uncharacterized protein n=1 Tax=Melastoma candidum TaxID=119954 RepID=A0ACB9QX48_9MYRT|nr:hypothetical protein MLD38_019142 [Melastoma candidum]